MLALEFPGENNQSNGKSNTNPKSLKKKSPKPVNLNFACDFCGKCFRDSRDKRIHEQSIHLKEISKSISNFL